jgi:hypothetical protein
MQQLSFPFQPYGKSPQGWEAVQFTDDAGEEAVLICFRSASTQSLSNLTLSRLLADATYSIKFTDAGIEQSATGRELTTKGLLVTLAEKDASEIVRLKRTG